MASRDSKFEEFYMNLKQKELVSVVDKYGLQDTSILNLRNPSVNTYKIYEFFVFSSEGIIVLNNKFHTINYQRGGEHDSNFHSFIKKIARKFHSFANQSQTKTSSKIKFQTQNNFSYQKLYYSHFKIIFLIKDGLTFAAVFQDNVKGYYAKLFLLHMYVSFINFNGTLIDTIKNINSDSDVDYSKNEFFQLKIYELYFIKHLTNHFERIFKFLIKKEEMYLSYIKFKNMYVVDLSNGEILFDMLSLRNSKKNQKIFRNEKLWQELIHHSKILMENYKNENGNKFDAKDSFYRFVKFECTSTYPRLTFIIKFIPVLNGVSIIHVYSQKKLSRMSENTDQHTINKGYKEIDLLYGTDVKNNNNIEFRYTEPRKLQEIEKFFIEFYISIRSGSSDIFHDMDHELKYFDYSVITTISEILSVRKDQIDEEDSPLSKINSIESIINKINLKLYEEYMRTCNGAEEKERAIAMKKCKRTEEDDVEIERDANNTSVFLIIRKDLILQELFSDKENYPKESNDKLQYENVNTQRSENKLNNSNEDFVTGIKASAKFYVDHGDGWLVSEGGNLISRAYHGPVTNPFNPNQATPKNKALSRAISNAANLNNNSNNVTINLSKFENDIGVTHQKTDESGFHFTLQPNHPNMDENNPINNTNMNINPTNINDDNTLMTIDYLMQELDAGKEKINTKDFTSSPRKEMTESNKMKSEKNIFETLIKNKTKSIESKRNSEFRKVNGSDYAGVSGIQGMPSGVGGISGNSGHTGNVGFLNLNIPLSNIFTQKTLPNKRCNFQRKETTPNMLNNKLTLYDGTENGNLNGKESNINRDHKKFHKLMTGNVYPGARNYFGGHNYINNFKEFKENQGEDESSIEHVKQIKYIQIVENHNNINNNSQENPLDTPDKLLEDEADNEQSPEYKESSISSGRNINK